jgi:hypothetical protein
MEKGKEATDAKVVPFKRLYGVKPATFEKMRSILQGEYDALHQKGGKTDDPRQAVYDHEIPAGVPDHGQYRSGIRRLQGLSLSVHPMGGKHTR